MKYTIIAIGDELLIGQVIDTNSGEIARILEPYGFSLDSVMTVHDSADAIRSAIDAAFLKTSLVITTGGLGPTKDDITKNVLCEYFGGSLVLNEQVLARVRAHFERRGLSMNELTEAQAMVPSTCKVIENRFGTAPVMWFEHQGRVLVSLPGVPLEAIGCIQEGVLPRLRETFPAVSFHLHRTVVISGITESGAAERLDHWERNLPEGLHLAYLPAYGIIRLRLDGTSSDEAVHEKLLNDYHRQLVNIFSSFVLADSDIPASQILINSLRTLGLTISTAESCTGGNIAHEITLRAGCSDVYRGSIVSYANDVKTSLLGVKKESISLRGVVSEEVVGQMAEGACRRLSTDCAIATSGIAGPGGATTGKLVGTVCIGVALPSGGEGLSTRVVTTTCHFSGSRENIINRATTAAIAMLIKELKKLDTTKE